MIPRLITGGLGLVLGTLYPAYASYKAVRTKNVQEYVKWMMYWIVFAFFTTFETVSDIFIAFWFPFYYEIKILLLLWLISPITNGSLGSSVLYRKFVHPNLMNNEEEIDRMIAKMQEQGYNTALRLTSSALNYVTNIVMQTAIKAPEYITSLAAIAHANRPTDQVDMGTRQIATEVHRNDHLVQNQRLQRSSVDFPVAGPSNPEGNVIIEEYESFSEIDLVAEDVMMETEDQNSSGIRIRETTTDVFSSDDDEMATPSASKVAKPTKNGGKGKKSNKRGPKKSSMELFSSDDDDTLDIVDPDFDPAPSVALTRRSGRAAKAKASEAISDEAKENKEKKTKTKKKN